MMILRYPALAVTAAALLSSAPFALGLSASDIPADTPVSSLRASANSNLGQGNFNDALVYFDAAIAKDPNDYLTIFKRGAAYLSLGKSAQANDDFNRALVIKPDFEGALLQRAKLKSKNADWAAAKQDYETAGKDATQELADLDQAQEAAKKAAEAEKAGDWEGCVSNAGIAVMVASTSLPLRTLRARCRLERGEVHEAVGDLAHVLQLSPGDVKPHLQMSSMMFYSIGDTERGLTQIRKCLHSDPDSIECSKLYKRERKLEKELSKVKKMIEKRQFAGATKVLIGSGEVSGLLQDIKDDLKTYKESGIIHAKAPEDLFLQLVELTCEAYVEMNNHKKGAAYCEDALARSAISLPGLLHKAQQQIGESQYEAAISTLNSAKEHHPGSSQIQNLLAKAHKLLKRSQQKDYYAVLGVASDADDKTIKRSYRQLTRQHHPDKAKSQGITKEEAEKKMASINEAYEVLSTPELRARFDNGDDPNSHEGQGGQPFQGSPFGPGAGGGGQQFFFRNGPGGGGQFKFNFPGGGGGGGGFPFP